MTCLECIANVEAPDEMLVASYMPRTARVDESTIVHAVVRDSTQRDREVGWWKCDLERRESRPFAMWQFKKDRMPW